MTKMTVLQAIVAEVILVVNVYSKYTTTETDPWGHIAGLQGIYPQRAMSYGDLWGKMLI